MSVTRWPISGPRMSRMFAYDPSAGIGILDSFWNSDPAVGVAARALVDEGVVGGDLDEELEHRVPGITVELREIILPLEQNGRPPPLDRLPKPHESPEIAALRVD